MKIIHFKEVTSTNDAAKDHLEDGVVIVADIQSQGRGRHARTWYSPQGGLWCSIVLKHGPAPILNLAAALAISKTFEYFDLETKLKWPNDVHIDNKKICGILSETEGGFLIMGIGINLNNKDFPQDIPGTSYYVETGKKINKLTFLEKFLDIFNGLYDTDFLDEYRRYSSTIGSRVTVKNGDDLTGIALDIDNQGRLLLKLETGKKIKIYSGEVLRLHQF
jgi:BirA family biotin operon repressor/biotin-[acetyl-CoA-carboxylase] ligase